MHAAAAALAERVAATKERTINYSRHQLHSGCTAIGSTAFHRID